MGLFDYLRCDYKPETCGKEFQTKDTPAQRLSNYKIDGEGRFWHKREKIDPGPRLRQIRTQYWIELYSFTGEIRFYDDDNEYSAYFEKGKVVQFNEVDKGAY